MNRIVKRVVWLLVLPLVLSAQFALAEDKTPSGTIVIDETQIMWIVGGDIGGGTLHFQGRSYKFKTDGLKLGGFGVNKVKLTGDVYDLKNIADFTGAYGVAEAGVTLGNASKGDFVMKNDKGVVLHLKSAAQGIALDLPVQGLLALQGILPLPEGSDKIVPPAGRFPGGPDVHGHLRSHRLAAHLVADHEAAMAEAARAVLQELKLV